MADSLGTRLAWGKIELETKKGGKRLHLAFFLLKRELKFLGVSL